MDSIFKELKASEEQREDILKFNPEIEKLDSIPAGTILNLGLYRANNSVSSSLKRITLKDKRVERNQLTFSPLISQNEFKTGLNNDAEISTSSRSYGFKLNFEFPQTPLASLNLYTELTNVEFTNIKIKQQTSQDTTPDSGESRFNYDIGLKGIFNRSNYFNNFSLLLFRRVDHQYYFSRAKTFFTSDVGRYTEIHNFSAWWMGVEFNQSLPFFNLPLEAGLSYNLILDGSITSDESSAVKNLNGTQGTAKLTWRMTDYKSFGVSYQNFTYRSEFSSEGSRVGIFGNFIL